jgi:hypothetical protein
MSTSSKRIWVIALALGALLAGAAVAGNNAQSLRDVTGGTLATPAPRTVAPHGTGTYLNQLPNGVNGLFSDTDCALCGTGQQSIAENFVLAAPAPVGELTIWGGYFPGDLPLATDVFRVLIHSDSGGAPGAVVYDESNVSSTKTQTGLVLFGVHEYEYTLNLATQVNLAAGTYWVEVFNDTTGNSDQWFWETGDLDVTNGIAGSGYAFETPAVTWNLDPATDLALQIDPGLPPEIVLTKTVGTVDGECAATDEVTVNSNTPVYYCFHVENVGSNTYNFHDLTDDHLGTILSNEPITLGPGDTAEYIVGSVATATVTNSATWTAFEVQPGYTADDTIPVDFVDISGTGTSFSLTDDSVSPPFPIGFDFNFYANAYTDVYVSSNGFITFLPGQPNGCCNGAPIPTASTPNGFVAGWWDDLNPSAGGSLYYQTMGSAPNRVFIVEFLNIPSFGDSNPNTFEYKLFEGSDVIEVHYLALGTNGNTHTVGIENQDGSDGVEYYLGSAVLPTPLAVQYSVSGGLTASSTDTATVNIADPDIAVDLASVELMQPVNSQVTLQENIHNNGIADLFWDIIESGASAQRSNIRNLPGAEHFWLHQFKAGPKPLPNPATAATHTFSGAANPLLGKVATPTVPESPDSTITITESATQNIVAGNSVACNNGVAHTDNSYIRAFDLSSFGINTAFDITDVSIGIEQATSGSGTQPVTMNLYLWNPADPFTFANFSLIGTADATVSDQSLTIIDVPVTGTAPAGSTLVVEFFTPDGNAGGNLLFVGSNADGQTAPTYLAAADCGVPDPTDVAVIGFPGMMLVMNVTGNAGCDVVDLPWLTLSSTSGTTAAGEMSQVGLTFDSTGLDPGGNYAGSICIDSNDPDSSTVRVPLVLEVDAMPFIDGFETGDTSRWSATVP